MSTSTRSSARTSATPPTRSRSRPLGCSGGVLAHKLELDLRLAHADAHALEVEALAECVCKSCGQSLQQVVLAGFGGLSQTGDDGAGGGGGFDSGGKHPVRHLAAESGEGEVGRAAP